MKGVFVRFARLDREKLTLRDRETYDRIANGPRQGVNGPFAVWLRSPAFADCAEAMGNYLRFDSTLPRNIKELAVLMVAKHWRASFVWDAHQTMARDAGLSQDAVVAIEHGHPHDVPDDGERRAFQLIAELLNSKRLRDRTWREAVEKFGDQGVVDLIGVVGYYCIVALTVVAAGLGSGEDGVPTFEPKA
jgi:4-carboxymuconolactone decarboxylase